MTTTTSGASSARKRFVAHIDRMCRCMDAAGATQEQALEVLRGFARDVHLTEEERAPVANGYIARTLYEDPSGWSVAAVVLQPGQETPPHDHENWGCAATVQGVERNRHYTGRCPDELTLLNEADAPPGEGYIFERREIHQAVGADPWQVTISLHFLAHGRHPERQICREEEQPASQR
jgi:predicted metal-dependent enzyme (double-stranded beta helix superfamily)